MDRKRVSIRNNLDGTTTLFFGSYTFHKHLDTKGMTQEEKFEAVRWSILNEGEVFTEKVEKSVRKGLGL